MNFDVSALNVQQDKANAARRGSYWFIVAVGLGLVFLFLLTYSRAPPGGTLSGNRLLALVSLLAGAVVLISLGTSGLLTTKGGVRRVQIDGVGLELFTGGRPAFRAEWAHPKLRIDLFDLTALPANVTRFPCPYTLRVGGFEVALTDEAGRQIIQESKEHGLIDEVTQGRGWAFPAHGRPIIHRISARPVRE
jgi:hypothetical protein